MFKCNFIILSCMCFISHPSFSQKQGNTWYFGDKAGVNFNTNPPTALTDGQTYFTPPLGWNEGTSSISDVNGVLLFYSNGEKIWNKSQSIMQNGDSLLGHTSTTSACLIVPQPTSSRYFYVFALDSWEKDFKNGLTYSVVDICLDNGMGGVIPNKKNIPLLNDTVAEKLIGIKHKNGEDYWIITHKYNSDAFYAFRLTRNGIIDTVVSHVGPVDPQGWGGQIVASPDGNRIAYAIPNGQSFGCTFLIDFNSTTGVVSNSQKLSAANTEYGVAFSPDNSKLYFSTIGHGEVFQYDLNAGSTADIIASKTYIIPTGPDSWRDMRLGPDGKIYLSRTQKLYLSVIANPNSKCPACNYIDSAIFLGGKNTSFGLPNFIAGFQYSNTTYNCDSLSDTTTYVQSNNNLNSTANIYPNPVSNDFTIDLPGNALYNINVLDMTGAIVYYINDVSKKVQVNYSFNKGVYILKAASKDRMIVRKLTVQ